MMKMRIRTLTLTICMGVALLMMNTGCLAEANVPNTTAPLWEAGSTRNKIVVMSDLHLGIEDNYTEMLKNRPLMIDFLKQVQNTADIRELVIAGDFLDEWFLPVYYPAYTDESAFYNGVIVNNQSLIDEFKNVIASGVKLVYVPGNHDLLLPDEVLEKALVKAAGEKKVRKAIEGGMSATQAFAEFGIL